MSKVGKVDFIISDNIKLTSKLIDLSIKYKINRLKSLGKINFLNDQSVINFYMNLPSYLNFESKLHASALVVDGNYVAIHIGIIHRQTFYYIFPTFQDGVYIKYSPGRILLWNLVQNSILYGFTKFDFTIGGEAYKSIWCNQVNSLYYFIASDNRLLCLISRIISFKYILKSSNILKKVVSFFIKLSYTSH